MRNIQSWTKLKELKKRGFIYTSMTDSKFYKFIEGAKIFLTIILKMENNSD